MLKLGMRFQPQREVPFCIVLAKRERTCKQPNRPSTVNCDLFCAHPTSKTIVHGSNENGAETTRTRAEINRRTLGA